MQELYNPLSVFVSVMSTLVLVLTLYFKVRRNINDQVDERIKKNQELLDERIKKNQQFIEEKIDSQIKLVLESIKNLENKINYLKEQQKIYTNGFKDKDRMIEQMLMSIKEKIDKMDHDLARTMSIVDMLKNNIK